MQSSKMLLKDGQTVDLVDGRIADADITNWNSKLDKNGDGSDVTVGFTESTNRTNIDTGRKLSTLFGQIRKWFSDMGALAFKDTVGASDVESGTYPIDISGNADKATTATTATATSSGKISADNDLNNYNDANRNYLCNATNASSVINKPSGASGAFELEVIRGTGSSCVQIYYSRDDLSFNYIRKYTGSNAWTDWVKLADSSDIKSLSSALDNMKWTKVVIDTNVNVEAQKLFTVGILHIGYYFDNGGQLRLSMKSTAGTRYIYLADNMGYGGGYQVTSSSWTSITMRGFSDGCQYESLIGYDCTSDEPIHFEVQFATSPSPSFGTICRYRVLEG